jgi:hypothetical protein
VNEADLTARHLWLCQQAEFRERMKSDPDYYDVKIAGWWVYGISAWIGGGWCSVQLPSAGNGNTDTHAHCRRPHLNRNTGVHRQIERGALGHTDYLLDYFDVLAQRLRGVRVCCGDWERVCGPTPTIKLGITGVFLDPPYSAEADRDGDIYAVDDLQVAKRVRDWAVGHGDNPDMRIALCGYEGEHEMPDSWECVAWKSHGGYGTISQAPDSRGRQNSKRERIWFSPHCLRPQKSIFNATIAI